MPHGQKETNDFLDMMPGVVCLRPDFHHDINGIILIGRRTEPAMMLIKLITENESDFGHRLCE
jgi:hypothetical protein